MGYFYSPGLLEEVIMNLSDEEVELVLQFRKAREAELERKKDKLFILKTAVS